jgi:hypothetical protein
MKKSITIILLLFLFSPMMGQVIINEYSASNLSNYVDNYDSQEDWIELFNTGNTSVNLSGYYLSDSSDDPTKWAIPSGLVIPANGYLVFWCSGRDESLGNNHHTNFKLKQTKNNPDHVVFSDTNGTIINDFELQKTQVEHSMGRYPNGSSTWKIFLSPSLGNSNNGSNFTSYASTPEMSLDAGFYLGTQTLEITTSEPNSFIRYTTNGNIPNGGDPLYTGPLTIDNTQIVKAIVISPDSEILPSFITFNTFFINVEHTLPVLSTSANELTVLLNGNINLRPHGTIEYFDTDGERKDFGYGEYNKHGQDSWQFDQRSFDYIARDEMGYHDAINEKLMSLSERESYQKIIIRASGDDNYPGIDSSAHMRDVFIQKLANKNDLNVDMRRGERTAVYANGQFWGVYSIREKVSDADYTNYYYGQDKYNTQYLMNWGGTWAQYGGSQAFTDWNTIHDYAKNNDLSNQTHYEYVANEIDVTSLVDYILINSYVVCTDWINWNTSWWRGLDQEGEHLKWGYVLWDEDATFNHYINYTNVPNENADAEPCYPEGIYLDPEEHIVLLNNLLENDEFTQYYITRYMDLMNTAFQEEEMIGVLEGIENSLIPEMPQHFSRWGGNMDQWQGNVQKIKDFIGDRNEYLPEGLNTCYNLTGPYDVTLEIEPEFAGQIKFNSITIENDEYPWTGQYHGGVDMLIKAVQSNPNYVFDHWEIDNHTVPDNSLTDISLLLTQSDNIKAVFAPSGGNDIVINEINYKDALDFEVKDWVELYNNGSSAIDISNWVFKDSDDLNEFVIPNGTIMQPDSYLVLVRSLVDFQALFPAVSPVLGDLSFGLGGGGELIRLFDNSGILVDFVEYDDVDPWPIEADGNGPSLELINPNLDNALPENWQACASVGSEHGTPGETNSDCNLGVDDFNNIEVTIFPNPMNTVTTIMVTNSVSQLKLAVYDLLGREIIQMESNSNIFTLEKGNLTSGLYILKITTDENTIVHTEKLIVK